MVIGGGHNGLVAACYLAKSGMSVLVLERLDVLGGATQCTSPFAGIPAEVSSYASMMGLFPDRIADDLGLDLQSRPPRISSFTPAVRHNLATGLLVERHEAEPTQAAFRELTGSDAEYNAWRSFQAEVGDLAKQVSASLMEPLAPASEMRERVDQETWEMLVERPLREAIESRFTDDTVRGLVAGDAFLHGMVDLDSPAAGRNYLYHALGTANGEWRVPLGGMGALTAALERSAWRFNVETVTHAFVTKVEADGRSARVTWQSDGEECFVDCDWVLGNVSPWVLKIMLGTQPGPRPEGSNVKVNMLVERLPKLRSDVSPARAFAGTMNIAAGYEELRQSYAAARAGQLPGVVPGQWTCTTLTDPSTLGQLAIDGMHLLSFLSMCTPARLFVEDVSGVRDEVVCRALDAINAHLDEPVESLIVRDADGAPCLEAFAPQDLEAALALPGGHVNHNELSWPWMPDNAPLETPAQRWGVQTHIDNVMVCGAGAQRGGAVSGIGGHNAAMAVLDSR